MYVNDILIRFDNLSLWEIKMKFQRTQRLCFGNLHPDSVQIPARDTVRYWICSKLKIVLLHSFEPMPVRVLLRKCAFALSLQ